MQEELKRGQVMTVSCNDISTVHDWLGHKIEESSETHVLISRLPPRRLLERLDISKIETHWLTENNAEGSLYPHLERMDSTIRERVNSSEGTIILEGIELLVGMHGWDAVMTFVRSLVDALSGTHWTLILPLDPLSIDSKYLAMLRREAPELSLPVISEEEIEPITEEEAEERIPEISVEQTLELTEDGTPRLVHLVRIPQSGFSRSTLRKRIMSWR